MNLSINILDPFIKQIIIILDLSIHLIIRAFVILMNPFCVNINTLFHMRDYILNFTLMPWDLGLMLWLDGGQGRL